MGIQLAKLGIINPKLIDFETVSHLSAEQFELIKTSVWIKENLVYFVLTIPQNLTAYPRFKILPIPDDDDKELVLSLNVDFVKKNGKILELENKKIKPLYDSCLENLLNNELSNCTFRTNKETSISFVPPNMVLTKNLQTTTITQNCNDLNISITGNNLVTFSNCKLKIGSFQSESKIHNPQINIIPFVKNSENLIKNNKDYITKIELTNTYHKKYAAKETNYIIVAIIVIILVIMMLKITKFFNVIRNRFVKKINEDIEISDEGRSDIHNIP